MSAGFNRDFRGKNGVVISLDTVIAGSREGVLKSLRDQHAEYERKLVLEEGRVRDLKVELEAAELDLARSVAGRDAAAMAIEAAERAFAV